MGEAWGGRRYRTTIHTILKVHLRTRPTLLPLSKVCPYYRGHLDHCTSQDTCSLHDQSIHVMGPNWSVVAERSSALDSSSGVARMWVRIPAWPVAALVSLSKTLNHNCFVLRMGRTVYCVMHVKETRTLIVKKKGTFPGISGFAP